MESEAKTNKFLTRSLFIDASNVCNIDIDTICSHQHATIEVLLNKAREDFVNDTEIMPTPIRKLLQKICDSSEQVAKFNNEKAKYFNERYLDDEIFLSIASTSGKIAPLQP